MEKGKEILAAGVGVVTFLTLTGCVNGLDKLVKKCTEHSVTDIETTYQEATNLLIRAKSLHPDDVPQDPTNNLKNSDDPVDGLGEVMCKSEEKNKEGNDMFFSHLADYY